MLVTTLVLHLLGEESLSDVVKSKNHSNSEEYSLGQMSLKNGLLEEPSIIGIHKKQEKLHAGCEAQKHERTLVHGRIGQIIHPHVGQMAQAYE